jgi:hypothetical protein
VATPRMIKHKRGIHERAARFHYCPFHGIGRLVLRRLFAYVYAHGAGLVPCWASAMGTIVLLDLMGGVALLLWGLHMVRSGLLSKAVGNRFSALAVGLHRKYRDAGGVERARLKPRVLQLPRPMRC